jgi:succinate dehydrogenase / fumarate reductase cytochrome b subunit
MIHTGAIIFIFLAIHLADFFVKKMTGGVPEITSGNLAGMEDMGLLIMEKFKLGGYVLFYVAALLFLGFHLDHAFQSAFQSLGLNHPKYTPFIKGLGHFVAIVLTVGFISIPIIIYFFK